jgi:hypothetical protein
MQGAPVAAIGATASDDPKLRDGFQAMGVLTVVKEANVSRRCLRERV